LVPAPGLDSFLRMHSEPVTKRNLLVAGAGTIPALVATVLSE